MSGAIDKVLILGHSGFIGRRLQAVLEHDRPDLIVVGLSAEDADLSEASAVERLVPLLTPATLVILAAAVKRQSKDDTESFLRNCRMVESVCRAVQQSPAARLVYMSSAAIYGEDIQYSLIAEDTSAQPRTYYGLAKFAGEWIIRQELDGKVPTSLLSVRPPTIYGPGEPGFPYGPTGFLRKAMSREPITLWGDGAELREFIFIDDAVRALIALSLGSATGAVNLVSGSSRTFTDIIAIIGDLLGRQPEVQSRPRSKARVDHRFDPGRLQALLPGFRFGSLEEGMAATLRGLATV